MINCADLCVIENEHLYGPGKRLLIYLQGCSLRCRGCFNRHMWEFGTGSDRSAEDILRMCREEDVEGVTLLGGEPLDQADGLLGVVEAVKDAGYTVILFTGYTKKELSGIQRKAWDMSDLVISGRYVEEKRSIYLQFRGSTNQRVFSHKGKYKGYRVKDGETAAIVTVSEDGVMNLRGFYSDELERACMDAVGKSDPQAVGTAVPHDPGKPVTEMNGKGGGRWLS